MGARQQRAAATGGLLGGWPAPEVSRNVSAELGDLGLTAGENAAIVAFLNALSDGYGK